MGEVKNNKAKFCVDLIILFWKKSQTHTHTLTVYNNCKNGYE